MSDAPDPLAPHGKLTNDAVKTIRAMHSWVRIVALASAIAGAIASVAIVIAFASRTDGGTGINSIERILRIVSVLVVLWSALLLFRYSEKLREAGQYRRVAPLLEALEHERTYWRLTAACTVVTLFSLVLTFGVAAMGGIVPAHVREEETPVQNALSSDYGAACRSNGR